MENRTNCVICHSNDLIFNFNINSTIDLISDKDYENS